jgi:hypothetical protein
VSEWVRERGEGEAGRREGRKEGRKDRRELSLTYGPI